LPTSAHISCSLYIYKYTCEVHLKFDSTLPLDCELHFTVDSSTDHRLQSNDVTTDMDVGWLVRSHHRVWIRPRYCEGTGLLSSILWKVLNILL